MAQQFLTPLLPTKVLHQFPNPTWIENLAIRKDGQVLVTLTSTPELYLIDPRSHPPKSTLIHRFSPHTATTGIVEIGNDVFAVCSGMFDYTTFNNQKGSWSVWEVDMSGFEATGKADVKKLVDLTQATLPNGMELLGKDTKEVLVADSKLGAVWKVNLKNGEHELAIQVEEMKVPAQGIPCGINGLKTHPGFLYWTNTGRKQFCRIAIDAEGKAIGKSEILAENIFADDFALDTDGNAWICQPGDNTIKVLRANGETMVVAGHQDSFQVAGGTACQFGGQADNKHMLYVTTNGSLTAPVNGEETEGGKLVAIDASRFFQ